jgi:GxxExxY protein
MQRERYNQLTAEIIGCAMEVHKQLGPGLLESAYMKCLRYELESKNISFTTEQILPLKYKGSEKIGVYYMDFLIEDHIVLEIKSVEAIHEIHRAQLLTYMKIGNYKLGLILNFNVKIMKDGIHRYVNRF